MLRDLQRILRDPLAYLSSCRDRWGDVVSFPLPRGNAWYVDDPGAVRRVLVDNARAYTKRTLQYDTLALVTGNGLLTSDGDRWRAHRRIVQPAFHHSRLPAVVGHAVAAADRVAGDWTAAAWAARPDGAVVDVDAAMLRAAVDVVGSALFSSDVNGEAGRVIAAVIDALDHVMARARSPWLPPPAVPTLGNLRLRRALRTLDHAVAEMVSQRRSAGVLGDDVLGELLAPHGHGERLDDRAIRDEVVTLAVAGHETVGASLTWAWCLLAWHPTEQQALHAELDAVLGGRAPRWADWPRLERTRAIVDETLRLYPPAWLISRRACEADRLADFALPAGSLVILSPWTLHRRTDLWPDAESFRPDRWLGAHRDQIDRHAYLPFGAGPRLCVGRDLALVEAVALLAVLAQRFTVDPVGHAPPRTDALVSVRPRGGLPLRVRRR